MKHVKMLALAAVVAASLMAFVGAGTASASVICSTTTTPCTSVVPNKTAFDFSSNKVTTTDTVGFVRSECASTLTGTLDNGTSTATAKLTATALTWTGCTITPAVTTVLGNLEIHNITGTSNGTVTANGFKVTQAILGNDCIYETGNGLDLGAMTEGKAPATAPKLSINVVLISTTMNCPATTKWVAEYTLTSPTETTLSLSSS